MIDLRIAALTVGFWATTAIADIPAMAATTATTVEQPRAFGHFLGDVLTQRIALDADAANDPPHLPPADRVATWFERRTPRIEVAADGRRWLAIDYQIINAPPMLTRVTLPGLTVTLKDGRSRRAGDWPLALGPMSTAAEADSEDSGLQADRSISSLPTDDTRRRLRNYAALLATTAAGWVLWLLWRNRRDAATLPFATAWRTLRRRAPGDPAEEAWLALHRALNATAGRALHAGSLPGFLRDRPALLALRPELEEFYRQSHQRFFSTTATATATATAPAVLSLVDLCRKLRRLEKRGVTGL